MSTIGLGFDFMRQEDGGKEYITTSHHTRLRSAMSLGTGNMSQTEASSTTEFSGNAFFRNSNMEKTPLNDNIHRFSGTGHSSNRHTSGFMDLRERDGMSVGSAKTSSTTPRTALERKNSGLSSVKTTTTSPDGSEGVLIEEKRRKAHGDGYTTHKYVRGRLLGKGGFAKVYLCTAMDTGKHYAIKIVPKANLVKARARTKLQTEIKIHRTLKHKNVCEYKHFFEDRENCYILLELCHNQSLNEMIKRRKRLTEPEAAFFMSQLLEAIKYIHSKQVIHRDLKLGNLFLDKGLNIKVGDLGLATRLEDPEEKRKTICGTPNYIAPEVIQNDKSKRGHSFEVDIWSMGVIMYTVLIGKPPYEAKDVKATYQRILANEYYFPEHIPISEKAVDLIESMLQTNPHERPSLEYISCHPFLAARNLPPSLPTSALHFAPSWVQTESGVFLDDDTVSLKSARSNRSNRSSNRKPFSLHDPNAVKPPLSSSKKSDSDHKRIDVPRIVKNALGIASKQRQNFKVYDETDEGRGGVEDSGTESLVNKAKSMAVSCATEKSKPAVSTTPRSDSADTDAQLLRRMVQRLDTVLEVTSSRRGHYRPYSPQATVALHSGPGRWVTRYVDYTSKYGLGFLLNDGTSGVYFNDSTKTSLERDGSRFQYVERRRNESDGVRTDVVVSTYTLTEYPEALNKKVTLLKHFRNYLLEQQKKSKEEELVFEALFEEDDQKFVYVKKWIRTKHAILFRLSDHTVQIVFYDQTEILLTPEDQTITYVDKNRSRNTYFLTDELVGSYSELEKRIKYSRDILQQLQSGHRCSCFFFHSS